jgi:hypothetical protein
VCTVKGVPPPCRAVQLDAACNALPHCEYVVEEMACKYP